MITYHRNTSKAKMLRYELPSGKAKDDWEKEIGGEDIPYIMVPSRLGGGAKAAIQQRAQRLHIAILPDGTQDQRVDIDPVGIAWETMIQALGNPRTWCNFVDENTGEPPVFTRYWIDHEMDEFDHDWLMNHVVNDFMDQLALERKERESKIAITDGPASSAPEGEEGNSAPPPTTRQGSPPPKK